MRNDTARRVIMWRDDIFVVNIFNFPATAAVLLIFLYGSLPRTGKILLKKIAIDFSFIVIRVLGTVNEPEGIRQPR
jgi:hypothetical protein